MILSLLTGLALAGTPAVSPTYGAVGMQIARSATCSTYAEATCLEVINNTTEAVAFGFSYRSPQGGQAGVQNAQVSEAGATQCVFTYGPSGTRCVSVLAPGEHGWVTFPSKSVIGIEVTGWSMPGLDIETPSILPGTTLPAVVVGDPYLITQGNLASQAWKHSCDLDLNVRGNNTLFVNMCR